MAIMDSRYKKKVTISTQILRLEALHGSLGWRITQLSAISQVSRSSIYELFGSGKKEILQNALKFFLDDFYGMSEERDVFVEKNGRTASYFLTRQHMQNTPEIDIFMIKSRNREDEIGRLIRSYEERYIHRLSETTGIKDRKKLLFLRTSFYGITRAPFLTDEEARYCFDQSISLVSRSDTDWF